MITFVPTSWNQVKAYDTIVFNMEANPESKPRLRRMTLTAAPYRYADAHSVEYGIASLTGFHVTKDGRRSKAYRSHRDDYVNARLSRVVSVSRPDYQVARDIAKVWDEAHAMNDMCCTLNPLDHSRRECPARNTDTWQDPEDGFGSMFFGADGSLVNPEATPEAAPVKPLSAPMQRAVDILARDGYVDTIDGVTVGTIVALMRRGILREATPLGHGLSAGRHYPATTPAQVWDEAYAEYDAREAAEVEADGGWGQPDGMLGVTEAERSTQGATVQVVALPPRAEIGIADADGAQLRIGDVVYVEGDTTLYGTVCSQDGVTYAIPLGTERVVEIDATRMHRASRGPDGGFVIPADAPSLPEGAITNGIGGTCRRMDGEHSTHGYARFGENCVPASVRAVARKCDGCGAEVGEPCRHPDGGTCATRVAREVPETPQERAARHELDRPLIEAFDDLRREHARHHAPTFAEDVAALRRETFRLWSAGTVGRQDGLARLDRIEAALRGAQRATGVDPAHVADIARHQFHQVLAVQGLPELHNAASRRFERAIERIQAAAAGR